MEGVSCGQGPIPDRDAPADGAPDRRGWRRPTGSAGAGSTSSWPATAERVGPGSSPARGAPDLAHLYADLYEDEIVRTRRS